MNSVGTKKGEALLKPCPFCGGTAELDIIPHMKGGVRVRCKKCHCGTENLGCGYIDEITKEAIEAWNRRVNNSGGEYYGKICIEATAALTSYEELSRFIGQFAAALDCDDDMRIFRGAIREKRVE